MRVQCPSCSKVFPVTAKVAGRKAKCSCGTVLQMPQLKPAATTAAQKIEMTCGSCNRRLAVPATAVGKLVQCPCGVKSPVSRSGAVSQTANSSGAATGDFGNDPFGNDPFGNEPFGNDPFADNSASNDPFGSSSSSGFEDDFGSAGSGGEYGLAPPAYLSPPKPRPKAKKRKRPAAAPVRSSGGPDFGQVLSGIGMMIGAVVWFVVALALGWFFPYTVVLLIVGFITMIKGFVAP